jgi:ATP-dependent protease ClpP protease subunit
VGLLTSGLGAASPQVGEAFLECGDRWFTASEAGAYGLADEVIGGPAGAPESGTPA